MPERVKINGPSLALVAPVDITEACLATPAFRAIRRARPDLTPVVLCPKSAVSFWSVHFQQVLSYDDSASPQKLAERFAGGTYHSALILEDSRAARALSRLGVPQRIGFAVPGLDKLLTDPITITMDHGPLPHRVTRYLKLAEELECDPHQAENFAPPPLPRRPSTPRIALAPDSDLGPAAEWPTASFLELTQSLTESLKPEFYLLSLPGKSPAADLLAKSLGSEQDKEPKRNSSAGDLGLDNLLELLPTFSTVVGSNGSLVNLAAHLGVPTVTLMGPHSPRTHRPLGKIHEVLTTYAECSPCHLAKCPLDHRCLNELSVETVTEAVKRVLA
ncbi:lipopolysaccharide heptosyltransferase II [Roseibacillus persicicus]|uniref:Lipopolysaccharide heptosyltransferase II n=1 Tax=Roseibacillus persicicus TaxID=454148 RepID=A0A918WK37_9BACT|nr:lipopolysaccharide heptosyltransferase II [Roseibacillus persicicus]